MPPTAVVLVTGSELVRGGRVDDNGPFLARELSTRGIEPARIIVVGDHPEKLEQAFREGLEADLLVTSGGLGPTHDDRTVEILARVAGRPLAVDAGLEEEIGQVVRNLSERFRRPYEEFEAGVRKQATIPEGANSLGLAGTAPGLVLEVDGSVVVVLPGPPGELQRLWGRALDTEVVQRVLAEALRPGHRILRFFGLPESAVARVVESAGGEGEGVDITICAHDLEVQVDLVVQPGSEAHADRLQEALREELPRALFADHERPVETIVLDLARESGLTIAAAESCTGGLVAARLTSVPGSSDVFAGGVVAYGDAVKTELLGVPVGLLERHGAVSAETAAAMASGARGALGSDVAISVTGVAGPGGGSEEKPVGLVYLHASGPGDELAVELRLPGDRDAVRRRAAASALHLLRRLLT
ncbi:MAG: competence/damage-inducible protein A, partial [Actinomycetota bacterium]|nr:competence/damage-inducible protein A [Actinomycetota bacterium]